MSRSRSTPPLPACFARCLPGLEDIVADEITREIGGNVRKTGKGLVVFRMDPIDQSIFRLKTTEDVFLFAWGTDQLTCKATDLKKIRHWTATSVNWNHLLQIHHGIRPKPKGKPTYHLVTQMEGGRAYFRSAAQKSFAQGLAGKFPSTWKPAEENASIEIWLTLQGKSAWCGIRLSDRTMRHRIWKIEHLPASLRPTMAAAMVRLARMKPGEVVLDPMCGAGTILGEAHQLACARRWEKQALWGGDLDLHALRCARSNLRKFEQDCLALWDVEYLPLPPRSVHRIICNPPFGKQLSDPALIKPLYRAMVEEMDRVLCPEGMAVLLVSNVEPLQRAAVEKNWESMRFVPVEVLGQSAMITVWRKPIQSDTME